MTSNNARRQILRLSMFMAPASAIGMILSIPVSLFTSSVLGPALSGVMRIVDIIQKYFGYNHFGMLQGMGREVPIELSKGNDTEARNIVREVFSGNAITTIVSLMVLWIFYLNGFDFNGVLELWLLIAISILIGVDRLNSLLHVYAQAYGYFDLIARRELFLKIFTPVVTVICVALLHLKGAVLAIVIINSSSMLFYMIGIKTLKWRFQVSVERLIRVTSVGFMVFANNYLGNLLETVGLLILAKEMTTLEVGLVGFAFRPLSIAASWVTSFDIYFSRHMLVSRGKAEGQENLYSKFQKYMQGSFTSYLLVVAILQGSAFLSFSALTRIFLPKFLASLPILQILLLMGMMYGVFTYLNYYMNATDQLGRRLFYIVITLGFNVAMVYYGLNQGFGMVSVAWAATISYTVFSALVLGIAIYQTSGRRQTAISFLIRTFMAMGVATSVAILLDSWTIVSFMQNEVTAQKITFGFVDLFPKLLLYIGTAIAIFLIAFQGFGLWTEIKNTTRQLIIMIRERSSTPKNEMI